MTYEILLIVVIGGIGSITGSCMALVPVRGLLGVVAALPGQEQTIGSWQVPLLRNGFRLVVFSVIIMVVVLFFRRASWASESFPIFCAERGKREGGRKMSETVLKINHLTMQFGGVVAVNDLSMEINRGEIVALIGPNGAGKTTAFNCVTGVYEPTNGEILFEGKPIARVIPPASMRKLYAGTMGDAYRASSPTRRIRLPAGALRAPFRTFAFSAP
ncbi:MAG: ATP-binding cassette domain-containing protein [Christensenellales bacterium]